MKGSVSENVVTKSVRVHLHGNVKGRVFEKVVSKEGWSLIRVVFHQGFLCICICATISYTMNT